MKDLNKLPDATLSKEIKRTDPIWRMMRIMRIVSIFLSLLFLSGIAYFLAGFFTGEKLFTILGSLFMLSLWLLQTVYQQISNERHWLRIGARRLDMLHNGISPQIQSARVPAPEAAPLPLVVSLDWNRKAIIITGITLLILLLLALVGYVLWRADGSDGYFFVVISGSLLFSIILVFLLGLAYQAYFLRQHIEIDEEGITTRYQRQEYRIRWQDARLFAQYSSNSYGGGQTFELSNEQVIVRWSKDATLGNYLLKAANNFADHNYYDTLIEQVNAQVAEHTHLPLLRLDIIKPATKKNQ
ncbi:hypothetical protein [Dictyobacter kobayashii]|uniref:Uncharacterized protein n=1 Tax=Dictyobacter kobayashii TaxID=2014872 RepID=A0A402AYE5_9CHLR|nr:hypothetical protein [Dictyobacter kobayashii]GCE24141.1 hypothetical protein KDK_79410 [Dictyobacter kobayashii]